MTNDIELTYSPLNCTVSKDGCTIEINIFKSADTNWFLEIIDQNNYSTCWEDQFETDQLAFDEAMSAIEEEGVLAFVEPTEGEAFH
ncbi:hypothetical protein [Methylomonas sp. ZR1]|uniref:hypothetical protein n=1 Tax=Methylomonas sp. ZR1 TaxID=1797072 RepID=UPI0014931F02|nr:hypothetical protein [Methylomonas sp. ZR1]NOV28352.1 hypothetical protein [Methylomonas sp. ZR1]